MNIKKYEREGYVVVKNIVPKYLIDDLFESMSQVFRKYYSTVDYFTGWDSPFLNNLMTRLRKEHPSTFSDMYTCMQTSVALQHFGTHEDITEIVKELIGDTLSVSDILLRMDGSDKRNKLKWHQDSSYFRQTKHDSCVCSVPLRDVDEELGALEILPRSHKERIEVEGKQKDKMTSKQYVIPEEHLKKYPIVQVVPLKVGDALFFDTNLIHRSGTNKTDQFRFTAIARFHNMLAKDFKIGRLVYETKS